MIDPEIRSRLRDEIGNYSDRDSYISDSAHSVGGSSSPGMHFPQHQRPPALKITFFGLIAFPHAAQWISRNSSSYTSAAK